MAHEIKLTRVFNHYNHDMAAVTLHLYVDLYIPSADITRLIQCTPIKISNYKIFITNSKLHKNSNIQ